MNIYPERLKTIVVVHKSTCCIVLRWMLYSCSLCLCGWCYRFISYIQKPCGYFQVLSYRDIILYCYVYYNIYLYLQQFKITLWYYEVMILFLDTNTTTVEKYTLQLTSLLSAPPLKYKEVIIVNLTTLSPTPNIWRTRTNYS